MTSFPLSATRPPCSDLFLRELSLEEFEKSSKSQTIFWGAEFGVYARQTCSVPGLNPVCQKY
jgi:hypothetical protein